MAQYRASGPTGKSGAAGSRDPQPAAAHVAYELGMFRTTFALFVPTTPASVVDLESYLLHTRNLIEFFWDGAPSGALLPKDFGGAPTRDKDVDFKRTRDDISQFLSHLTWDRVTQDPASWSYQRLRAMHDGVRTKARSFFKSVPAEHLVWFGVQAFPNEYVHWQ